MFATIFIINVMVKMFHKYTWTLDTTGYMKSLHVQNMFDWTMSYMFQELFSCGTLACKYVTVKEIAMAIREIQILYTIHQSDIIDSPPLS